MSFWALDRGKQRLARLLEGHFDVGRKGAEPAPHAAPRRKPWESEEPAPPAVTAVSSGGVVPQRQDAGLPKPWEHETAPVVPRREVTRPAAIAVPPRSAARPERRGGGGEANAALALSDPRSEIRPGLVQIGELRGGDVVGECCEIERLIGRSRCYSVYRARHRAWDIDVAVKVPRLDCAGAEGLVKVFAAAAERWTGLGMHPNVASCYYTQVVDGVPLAVIENVAGGNLQPWIASGRARNLRVGLSLALQICHGLEWAHEAHVWHGALKPENCLIGAAGDVAITDFAIAGRALTPLAERSERAECYVAPECWVDPTRLDASVDVFCLGVCLHELLLGIRPHEMTRGPRRAAAVPAAALGALPEALADLLRRCVEWEPGKRPPCVAEVRRQLAAVHLELFAKESPFAEPPIGSWEADGWNNRALAAQLLGHAADADVAWENALAADAKHLAAIYNYGVARWRGAALPDLAVVRQLEQAGGRAAAVAPLLAAVHCERGDHAAAQRILRDIERDALPSALRELLGDAGEPAAAAGPLREWDDYASYLTSVSLSPDGDLVVFATDDGGVFSARTDIVESARELSGHNSSVSSVDVAASGRCAFSAGEDDVVRVWDLSTRRCLREIPTPGKVLAAAFHEQRSLLALACSDAQSFAGLDGTQLLVWDVERERVLFQLKGHSNSCRAVAISADGGSVVSGSDDLTVRVWDLHHNGQCRRVLEGNQHFVAAVAVSADGNVVVSAGWDKSVRVWNLATGAARVLWGHLGIVNAVAVSADGGTVVSGGWDRTVRIWNAASGRCLRTIEAHTGIVSGVSVSADGLTVASAGWDKAARVWIVPPRWEPVCAPLLVRRRPYAVLPSGEPDADELCDRGEAALRAGRVEEALELVRRARAGDAAPARAADLWKRLGQLCRRTEVTDLRPLAKLRFSGACGGATFANCGRWLVSGGLDGAITVWNVALERRERRLEGHEGRVACVASSDDGGTLLSGGVDRSVRIWEPDTGRCARVLQGHSSIVTALAVSPDGRWILSGGCDHEVRLWDSAAARCVAVFSGHRRQIAAVALDAERGRYAAGDRAGVIRVGGLRAPGAVTELAGHQARIAGLRFAGDGRRLLSGDASGALRLWDLESSSCLGVLEGQSAPLVWVDFRAESEWAAALATDGKIVFWNTTTGQATATAALGGAQTCAGALTADGDTLLILGADGDAALWELAWDLAAAPSSPAV